MSSIGSCDRYTKGSLLWPVGPRLYDLCFLARPSDGHSPVESDEPLIDDAVAAKGTTLAGLWRILTGSTIESFRQNAQNTASGLTAEPVPPGSRKGEIM